MNKIIGFLTFCGTPDAKIRERQTEAILNLSMSAFLILGVIFALIAIITIARYVKEKRRERERIAIYEYDDKVAPKGDNLDTRSQYDNRLLKKYESLAIWIKLRERYGKRLISYCLKDVDDTDRVNINKALLGMPIFVKYVSADGRVLTDEMYIKFLSFHDMALVTNSEYEGLKRGEDVEFSITPSEINAMKEKHNNLSLIPEAEIVKIIRAEKRKVR